MLELALDPAIWAAFLTLTALEIVLGIDNLILISILTDRLPKEKKKFARKLGLMAALATRILLLSIAFWIAHLEETLFTIFDVGISGRDILLLLGGLFLLAKGTSEIHEQLEDAADPQKVAKFTAFGMVIIQIAVMDIVFSFDSVITAIGIADHLSVMVTAIVISMIIMAMAVDKVSDFITAHPTVKMLGLSFMLLIGTALIADGLDFHIPKGYLYFAMAFSFMVEVLNMKVRSIKAKKVD